MRRIPRPRSLRTQVTLGAALLVVLVVALAGLTIALRIDHEDRAQVDQQLQARATKILADRGKVQDRGSLLAEGEKAGQNDTNLLAGTESLTRVLSGSEVLASRGEGVSGAVPLPTATGLTTVRIAGRPWRSLVAVYDQVPDGRLQILQSLAPVQQRLDDNTRLIALVGLAATLLAAIGAWLVAGLLLRPLQRLRLGALAIHPGVDSGPQLLDVAGPLEIADLAATLNTMLERLQLSMQATRRFTADAGHELRTPLTGLGMDLETLRRNPDLAVDRRETMLAAMTVEHDRVVSLLNGLQQLARGDAEALPERSLTDVGEIVEAAVRAASRRHTAIRYRSSIGTEPFLTVGWPGGLRIALDNLLDNAALHGRPDGTVDAVVSGEGDLVAVIVSDDGPGIPEHERESMKQRFARGTRPRGPGSGLGLAVVEQQARLHGGTLTLGRSAAGGLRVTLSLPRAEVAAG
jgi:two-component system sensor histidine kinase PrrB